MTKKRPEPTKPGTTKPGATSPRTKTQPESARDGFFDGPDPATWLHVVGTSRFIPLPRRKSCTLGSSSKNDIVVKAPWISRRHCTLERLYDCVRVIDHSSNGTWVDHRLAKNATRDVRVGGTFVAGGITFLVLNDKMYEAFPLLSDILDWEDDDEPTPKDRAWPMPSNIIVWASGTEHMLVVGPRGCDQERLVETIHAISPMRSRDMVTVDSLPTTTAAQRDLLMRAQKTTLVLMIDDETPVMDPSFRAMLFSPSYRIRVLVCARSLERAQKVLGPEHTCQRRIDLRALAFRVDQLPRLLDRQLEQEGASLRFEALTDSNRDALLRCEWRRNLDDLRTAARRLPVIHREPSLRKAAVALGIKNFNVLQDWFTATMGLTLPLTEES